MCVYMYVSVTVKVCIYMRCGKEPKSKIMFLGTGSFMQTFFSISPSIDSICIKMIVNEC